MPQKHGGKRPGAGRKPKSAQPVDSPQSTSHKAKDRERVRKLISRHLPELIKAQLHNALGIHHFFLRNQNGQWERITDPKAIEQALNAGKEHYWIFTKDPSVQAFTDLLNRVIDKPAEQVELTGADKGPVIFKWQD